MKKTFRRIKRPRKKGMFVNVEDDRRNLRNLALA